MCAPQSSYFENLMPRTTVVGDGASLMENTQTTLHVWRLKDSLNCHPVFHLILRRGLWLISTPHTRLSGLQALKELSWLYPHHLVWAQRFQMCGLLSPGFHICLGEPNLGLQVCQVSTLPTESSSQARTCSYEWIKIATMFVNYPQVQLPLSTVALCVSPFSSSFSSSSSLF